MKHKTTKHFETDAARIASEEKSCWREYRKQKNAEAKVAEKEIKAYMEGRLNPEAVIDPEIGIPTPKASRRRSDANRAKDKIQRNAADAQANIQARKSTDKECGVHVTEKGCYGGYKKSRVGRANELAKRASKFKK